MVLAEALTEAELIRILLEKPVAMWAFVLARFGPIAVGLGLVLAALIRRQDRKRAGEPEPPMATVTVPFQLGEAVLLFVFGFLILPPMLLYFLHGPDVASAPLWMQVVASAVGTIPPAIIVVLRRQRMRLQAPDAATQPPAVPGAFLAGLRTVCIALLWATPLAIGWTFLIRAITGETPPLQNLVSLALSDEATYEPWLIAVFGVFVAPFTEEAIFRGLLYPAVRSTATKFGTSARRALWISAVITSLLFAAVHGNVLAFVPLFVLAMVLAWVFQKTNSLAACIIAHAVHNALSMIPILVLRLA